MKAYRARFPIRVMCRVLDLSPSGYYAWLKRPPTNQARRDQTLREMIVQVWNENWRVYGRPRPHAELRARGERTSPKRVGRLVKDAGIQGASRRRQKAGLTGRDRESRPAPDLLNRNFAAEGPDQLWVADLTYVRTQAGLVVRVRGPGRLEPLGRGLGDGEPISAPNWSKRRSQWR